MYGIKEASSGETPIVSALSFCAVFTTEFSTAEICEFANNSVCFGIGNVMLNKIFEFGSNSTSVKSAFTIFTTISLITLGFVIVCVKTFLSLT